MLQNIFDILISVRDTFSCHIVFGLGILLVGSYFTGKLTERFKIPAITGFIIAGLILGPSITGIIHIELQKTLGSITEIALAIIALAIGSEFSLVKLRKVGKAVVIITVVQLLMTFTIVTTSLWIAGMEIRIASLLGAIATATAPAATVAIIRNLKARGPFVDHLFGVVALDDAGCILLFSTVLAFAGSAFGDISLSFFQTISHALIEIFLSLVIGLIGGGALFVFVRNLRRNNEILIISLGLVFLIAAVTAALHLSALLASMAAGMILANLSRRSYRILHSLENVSPPLYAAFFAIAGTELNISVFSSGRIIFLGSLFILTRAIGKFGGVSIGATLAGSDRLIRKYLGFSMLPQAGVAIGLVLFLQSSPVFASCSAELATIVDTMVSIVLFSVFINELAGPPFSRYAVIRGATL
jgi:Kef-type K+ transport system membrane component KefB